jgi:hypothetical protein
VTNELDAQRERVMRDLITTPWQVKTEQVELFAKPLTDERIDELIVEAAKRAGYGVVMAGERVSGHCGGYTQQHTIVKIGMEHFRPRELRALFSTFLTLTNTEV